MNEDKKKPVLLLTSNFSDPYQVVAHGCQSSLNEKQI